MNPAVDPLPTMTLARKLEPAMSMKPRRQLSLSRVASALAALVLCACAGPVYLNRLPYAEGWREGIVTDVGSIGHAFGHAGKDCRSQWTGAGSPDRTFAQVEYEYARNYYSVIAAVPDKTTVRKGDVVYVHSADCGKEIVPAAR